MLQRADGDEVQRAEFLSHFAYPGTTILGAVFGEGIDSESKLNRDGLFRLNLAASGTSALPGFVQQRVEVLSSAWEGVRLR